MAGGKKKQRKRVSAAEAELVVRHDLSKRKIAAAGRVALVVAAAIPIAALRWVLEPFAGEDTNVNVTLAMSLALGGSLAMNVFLGTKVSLQRVTIKRLRGREDRLEEQLGVSAQPLRGTIVLSQETEPQ